MMRDSKCSTIPSVASVNMATGVAGEIGRHSITSWIGCSTALVTKVSLNHQRNGMNTKEQVKDFIKSSTSKRYLRILMITSATFSQKTNMAGTLVFCENVAEV